MEEHIQQEKTFPLYYQGDSQLFKHIEPMLDATILLPKKQFILLPFKLVKLEDHNNFLEPIIQMEVLGEV